MPAKSQAETIIATYGYLGKIYRITNPRMTSSSKNGFKITYTRINLGQEV